MTTKPQPIDEMAQDDVSHAAPNQPKRPARTGTAGKLIVGVAVLAFLVSASIYAARVMQPDETGPKMTHVVTRGRLVVTVVEQGMVESSENTEIKSKVRGRNAVIWIIENGSVVKKGEDLVKLDSLFIQEQIDERTKYANWSQSAADHSAARLARAKLAVGEYENGRFVAELMRKEKELVVAEANLRNKQDKLSHVKTMARSEYESELQVEEQQFAVDQAKLVVELKRTELEVLKDFEKREQLQTLKGNLKSVEATHGANVERAMADGSRRDRAEAEIKHCTITAPRDGLVIHPNAAKWEAGPIEEGTRVHKDQVLLLMPNLSKMQVKVGIKESIVDRIKKGLKANIVAPGLELKGEVASVASVTRPAGWWTANEVKYDTFISLPSHRLLRPGMSAEVEVIIAEYDDVLTIPVASIAESEDGFFCWVKTADGDVEKRVIEIGDTNDVFTIVTSGLAEGDEVILNPIAYGPVSSEKEQEKADEESKTPDKKTADS